MRSRTLRLLLATILVVTTLPGPCIGSPCCCASEKHATHHDADDCCADDCCDHHHTTTDAEPTPAPKPQPREHACVTWCCAGFVPLMIPATIPAPPEPFETAVPNRCNRPSDGFQPRIEHPPRLS